MDVSKVTIKNLLEAGIHFGHKTKRWNPKMQNYIFGERNGIHIIDLQQTVISFRNALEVIKKFSSQNKNILFVGTKRQASEIISTSAIKCEQYYINNRWLGGMLTNWDTIQNSIKRLKDLEVILEEQSFTYTKKETLQFEKSVEKLNKALGGIKNMNGRPDLLFIIDTNREVLAVKEAVKMGIPIIGVLDSNSDPDGIDYPIPGNDDAMRSIEYYCTIISDTIIESRKNIKSDLNEKK
jgi:small subunit ribosomal protein S2